MALVAYEFWAFGQEYAKQVISNAKALAEAMASLGFDVQAKEFGFTERHQVAVSMADFGGGDEVARHLKDNNIICNMNLLPFESLESVNTPARVRLGVQEMTRFGMNEPEMKQIAEFLKLVVMDAKLIRDEVTEFRSQFQKVHYSFDE